MAGTHKSLRYLTEAFFMLFVTISGKISKKSEKINFI